MSSKKYKKRRPKRRYAVIGEGPTEWHFVNSINKKEDIKVSVRPSLPKHSDYKSIFDKAKALVREGYDKVYCLIDMDVNCKDRKSYDNYNSAKKSVIKNKRITVFETMPCIEYWFLLHFKGYSNKIYSTCDEVIQELKKYIPNYSKNTDFLKKISLYEYLLERGNLEEAKNNARRLKEESQGQENIQYPFSDIHIFLEELLRR